MFESTVLLSIAVMCWFCFDSLRARENALIEGRRACERDSLQFLDETVECISLRLARNEFGQMKWRRVYRFEFSDDGNSRRNGSIVMLGGQVDSVMMEPFLLH